MYAEQPVTELLTIFPCYSFPTCSSDFAYNHLRLAPAHLYKHSCGLHVGPAAAPFSPPLYLCAPKSLTQFDRLLTTYKTAEPLSVYKTSH
jgi:hypothetical protein